MSTTSSGGRAEAFPVLAGRGLTKRYGHVVALDNADFDARSGEILAVVGDNGAGKSTLIKALSGVATPDSGQVFIDGQPASLRSPAEARRRGVETVYQELVLAQSLDIATNMFLGREMRRKGVLGTVFRCLDKRGMRALAIEALLELGIQTVGSVRQPVETLSGGQRQAVVVSRAAAWGRRVLILDEPTSALGVRETGQVEQLILRAKASGLAVVLITHNMPQIFEIADRVHVHRLGRRVALASKEAVSMQDVVGMMTGAVEVPEELRVAPEPSLIGDA